MVCVLSIEEAIGIPCRYTRTSALDAVARFSGIQSLRNAFRRTNPGNLGRLQMETLESGFIENKGVPACKRIGTSQFPIGDDVSALHPLRSSVGISAVSPPIHQYPSQLRTLFVLIREHDQFSRCRVGKCASHLSPTPRPQ